MELMNASMATAICAQVGCTWSTRNQDFGIDLQVHGELYETDPQIDFQLKATTNFAIIKEKLGIIKYPLDAKNYADLIKTNVRKPRLLCLAILPNDPMTWVVQRPFQLELRYGIYWLNLQGLPPRPNTSTVTVEIPLNNKLDSSTLSRLMKAVNETGSIA